MRALRADTRALAISVGTPARARLMQQIRPQLGLDHDQQPRTQARQGSAARCPADRRAHSAPPRPGSSARARARPVGVAQVSVISSAGWRSRRASISMAADLHLPTETACTQTPPPLAPRAESKARRASRANSRARTGRATATLQRANGSARYSSSV